MQHQTRPAEHAFQEPGQRLGDLAELREHQGLFLPLGQLLAKLGQALKFAAVFRVVVPVTKQLGRMIADLLEAHQLGQHQAAPLDALRFSSLSSRSRTACS